MGLVVVDFNFSVFVDFNFVSVWLCCVGSGGLMRVEDLLFVF